MRRRRRQSPPVQARRLSRRAVLGFRLYARLTVSYRAAGVSFPQMPRVCWQKHRSRAAYYVSLPSVL